ncbi:MAG: hypothetical protein A3E87_09515 [Gammaproteobacteria bacterium RIFCSPHIGHO2_12_FULL_35_23]|nr:MAG: hypothetical protein A3E87_09515 [Gammaproteobacteria bacterium RIFCSPHIGHO2_12_FULL_35_23]
MPIVQLLDRRLSKILLKTDPLKPEELEFVIASIRKTSGVAHQKSSRFKRVAKVIDSALNQANKVEILCTLQPTTWLALVKKVARRVGPRVTLRAKLVRIDSRLGEVVDEAVRSREKGGVEKIKQLLAAIALKWRASIPAAVGSAGGAAAGASAEVSAGTVGTASTKKQGIKRLYTEDVSTATMGVWAGAGAGASTGADLSAAGVSAGDTSSYISLPLPSTFGRIDTGASTGDAAGPLLPLPLPPLWALGRTDSSGPDADVARTLSNVSLFSTTDILAALASPPGSQELAVRTDFSSSALGSLSDLPTADSTSASTGILAASFRRAKHYVLAANRLGRLASREGVVPDTRLSTDSGLLSTEQPPVIPIDPIAIGRTASSGSATVGAAAPVGRSASGSSGFPQVHIPIVDQEEPEQAVQVQRAKRVCR